MPRSSRSVRVPRPGLGRATLLWVLAPFLILLVVWQQASVDRLVVQLDEAQEDHQELESQVNTLSLEVNRLSSLGKVERRATRELGLGRPGTDQIVDLQFQGSGDSEASFVIRPLVTDANAETPGARRPR